MIQANALLASLKPTTLPWVVVVVVVVVFVVTVVVVVCFCTNVCTCTGQQPCFYTLVHPQCVMAYGCQQPHSCFINIYLNYWYISVQMIRILFVLLLLSGFCCWLFCVC